MALGVSYLGSIRGYLDQRSDLGRQQTALQRLMDERDAIRERLSSLETPAVIEARARELGYIKPGEVPIQVTDLEVAPPPQLARARGGGFWDFLPAF